jgi:hypothetical protein
VCQYAVCACAHKDRCSARSVYSLGQIGHDGIQNTSCEPKKSLQMKSTHSNTQILAGDANSNARLPDCKQAYVRAVYALHLASGIISSLAADA